MAPKKVVTKKAVEVDADAAVAVAPEPVKAVPVAVATAAASAAASAVAAEPELATWRRTTSRIQAQAEKAVAVLLQQRAAAVAAPAAPMHSDPRAAAALELFGGPAGGASAVGAPVAKIALEVTYLNAPEPNRAPLTLWLPNAVHDRARNICLVTPAPQQKYKQEMEDDETPAPANVTKVLDVVKLEGRFGGSAVAMRALAKAYDAFFIHNDVEVFPAVLTGEFMSHHMPVWLDGAKRRSLNERLQRTLHRVTVPRRGDESVIFDVAHCEMAPLAVVDNVCSAMHGVVRALENGWKDVLSARVSVVLGAGRRLALPFYAHDFAESQGLGTDAAVVPVAPRRLRSASAAVEERIVAQVEAKKAKAEGVKPAAKKANGTVAAAAAAPQAKKVAAPTEPAPVAAPAATVAVDADDEDAMPDIDISAPAPKAAAAASPKAPAKKAAAAAASPKGKASPKK